MTHWDVFHSDRLEAERSLSTEDVRAALARGDLVEDDLIRPAGSARWARLGDAPEFVDRATVPPPPPRPIARPSVDENEPDSAESDLTRFEFDFDPDPDSAIARSGPDPEDNNARIVRPGAVPVLPDDEAGRPDLPELDEIEAEGEGEIEADEFDPQDEDEEAAEFTLSRPSSERVEELDLAAMVDVAFQLVLFFLVTATSVVFKTLEVPRPNEDRPPEAAVQARAKSIEELEKDFILVEVDAAGAVKVDRQPVAADRPAIAERLRAARESTGRKAMLLSADYATQHRNAVLALDVANEVELQIAIAQPTGKK